MNTKRNMDNKPLFALFLLISVPTCVMHGTKDKDFIGKVTKDYDLFIKLYGYARYSVGERIEAYDIYTNIWPITIFDPINQVHNINCPYHQAERLCYVQNNWAHARILYDVNKIILLVSTRYYCKKGHEVLSTNEEIVNVVKRKYIHFPLILSHKCGFTIDFLSFIRELVYVGIPFTRIHNLIKERYLSNMILKGKLNLLPNCDFGENDGILRMPRDIKNLLSKTCKNIPSYDSIERLFLADFEMYEKSLCHEMSSIPASYIKCDHTFKVASNIGVKSELSQKWEKQFDALFIVLNEYDQVIAWQLTNSLLFSNVESLLTSVKDKSLQKGKEVQFAVIDNCCLMRNKF